MDSVMSSLNVADPEVHASNARKLLTAQAALALLACLSASEFAAWAAAQLALALWALSSFELGREDARALYCIATPLRWLLDAVWLGLWTHPMAKASGANHYGATVHWLLFCMWCHFLLESVGAWFWWKLYKTGGLEAGAAGGSGAVGFQPMLAADNGGGSGGDAYAAPPTPDPFRGAPAKDAPVASADSYQNVGQIGPEHANTPHERTHAQGLVLKS